jgi:hypothetical protein
MPSSAFFKYNNYIDELSKGGHNLTTAVFKLALTNTAPTAASDTVWNTTVAPAPAAANGYTAGGNTSPASARTTKRPKRCPASSIFNIVER